MTDGQAKREAYIRAQLEQRRKEEAADESKLPKSCQKIAGPKKISNEEKKKIAKQNQRRMTYFDGNLMAAIMDMDLNESGADKDAMHLIKTKTKGILDIDIQKSTNYPF